MRSGIHTMCVFDEIKYAETLCVFLKRVLMVENFITTSKLLTFTSRKLLASWYLNMNYQVILLERVRYRRAQQPAGSVTRFSNESARCSCGEVDRSSRLVTEREVPSLSPALGATGRPCERFDSQFCAVGKYVFAQARLLVTSVVAVTFLIH
jgi:hypothetical protein